MTGSWGGSKAGPPPEGDTITTSTEVPPELLPQPGTRGAGRQHFWGKNTQILPRREGTAAAKPGTREHVGTRVGYTDVHIWAAPHPPTPGGSGLPSQSMGTHPGVPGVREGIPTPKFRGPGGTQWSGGNPHRSLTAKFSGLGGTRVPRMGAHKCLKVGPGVWG